MRYKVQIYQTTKEIGERGETPQIAKSTLIGEAYYVIGELMKHKETGLVGQLQLPLEENESKNKVLKNLKSTCTMRFELIEQTNTFIKF